MGGGGDYIETFMQKLEGGGAGRETLGMPSGVTLCSASCLVVILSCIRILLLHYFQVDFHFFHLQLSATDVSARTTMKGAAKCDKHCELQNSVNQ